MTLSGFVGLTAIDVSLCGPTDLVSQSVLTFASAAGVDEQNGVPILTVGPEPLTAVAIGAGESTPLCVKSIGCGSSSAAAIAVPRMANATSARPSSKPSLR